MMHLLKLLRVFIVFLCLSGCVTTTTDDSTKVDKQAALEANVKLGMAYLDKGLRDGALRSFNSALELDKNSSEANLGMALLRQLNGEVEQAEKSFLKALRGRADFSKATVQFSYGKFLLEQERVDEAIHYFELVTQEFTYTGRADALYYLGIASLNKNDVLRAKGAFQYALNLKPNLVGPALELADIAFNEGDYANAKKYLGMYERGARNSSRSLWLGIRLERIFGNKDKEASYALALKNLHPYSKEYLEYKNLIERNQ